MDLVVGQAIAGIRMIKIVLAKKIDRMRRFQALQGLQ